jgi:hypothetical protein
MKRDAALMSSQLPWRQTPAREPASFVYGHTQERRMPPNKAANTSMMAKLAELRELNPDKAEQFVRSTAYLTPSERMQVPRIDGHGIHCSDSCSHQCDSKTVLHRVHRCRKRWASDYRRLLWPRGNHQPITSPPVFPCLSNDVFYSQGSSEQARQGPNPGMVPIHSPALSRV